MSRNMFHMLDGQDIYFKKLTLDDAIDIHRFASDHKVTKYIGWTQSKQFEDTLRLIQGMIEKESEGSRLYASIVNKQSGKIIGTCMLFNFNNQAKHAEIGYVINSKYWNKGYCSEVIKIISDYALEYLNLHKLHARVVDTNTASSKVLEKNGFQLEGRLKDYYYIEEKYYDGLLYGKILTGE